MTELNPVKVRGAVQTPVAAELMWVRDASVVYKGCLLATTKFSNVQGVLLSAAFMLPALMHPSSSQSWRGSQWPARPLRALFPYEIRHCVEL